MNSPLNILVLIFLFASCNSQNEKMDLSLDKNQSYNRISGKNSWGYLNQDGDTIIPLEKYTFLNPIDDEGMILAESKGKHGYINILQDTLIPFVYYDLGVFSYGLAPAKQNGKYGFINRGGEVVIPFIYGGSKSYFYKCQLAEVKLDGKYGFIDKNGKIVIPIKFEQVSSNKIDSLVCAMQNGKWAFFSCSGEQLTNFEYDKITESYYNDLNYTYFERGLCRVERNGKIAYLNKEFKEVVNFGTYDASEPFRNYLGIVSKNGKYGIIDTLGNIVLPIKYDFIEHPTEYSNESDLFSVRKGQNIQLLDKTAKPITDFNIKEFEWDIYEGIDSYQRYFVLTNNLGMVGTVSDKGIKEIPFDYQQINPFDGKSVTFAKKNGKFGLIDYSGKVILPFEFDNVYSHKFFDYYIIRKEGKIGVFDKFGNQIISYAYQDIKPVYYDSNNRFIVQQNGLFGVIDKEENVIIPIDFDEISNWVEYGPEEHFITKKGKKGLISREGKIVIPPIYDDIEVNNPELIKVNKNGLFGTIDWKNNIVGTWTTEDGSETLIIKRNYLVYKDASLDIEDTCFYETETWGCC